MSFVTEKIEPGILGVRVVDDTAVNIVGATPDGDGGDLLSTQLARLRIDVDTATAGTNRPISNSFITFRASVTINNANLALYNGISALYTATVDQNIFVNLPTAAHIATAAIPYPIRLEFTHLGGTSRGLDNVMIVNRLTGEEDIQTRVNGDQAFTTLHVTNGVLLEKAAADAKWIETRFAVDPSETLLPTGLFTLRNDFVISDIANVSTILASATIARGDAFLVITGGSYFGTTVADGDVIVAEQAAPSLLTSSTGWLIVRNTNNAATTTENVLLLSNFARSGIRFDGNRNVFINEANVNIDIFEASIFPYTQVFALDSADDTGPTLITVDLSGSVPAFTFPDLVGGRVEISIQYRAVRTGSITPGLRALRLTWTSAAITMTFDATGLSSTNGIATLATTIPDVDYSGITGVAPDVIEQDMEWRGTLYSGVFLITALRNTRTGPLHDPITALAQTAAGNAIAVTTAAIADLEAGVGENARQFQALEPRLSPIRTIRNEVDDVQDVFFGQLSGGSAGNLANYTRVDPDHATFTLDGTGVFIVVGTQHAHDLFNLTDGSTVQLSRAGALGNARLSIEASFTDTLDGVAQTFFVFLYGSNTIGDVVQVREPVTSTVAAWQNDIDILRAAVAQINAQLGSNVLLTMSPATQSWLANDLSIVDVTTPVFTPTGFNGSFSTDGSQAFFREDRLSDIPASGFQQTQAMVNVAGRRGRKTIFMPMSGHLESQGTMIQSFGGDLPSGPVLMVRDGGEVKVRRFLPATPSGSRSVTRRPTPAGRVGDWFRVIGHDPVNNQPIATEIDFTENLPQVSTAVNTRVRWAANGQVGTPVALGVFAGGDANLIGSAVLTLSNGQLVDVTASYRAATRDIEVQFVPRASPGTFFIFDYDVQMDWTETVDTPATTASSELVFAGNYVVGQILPLLFGPSNTRTDGSATNLVIATPTAEIDTGYSYNDLFSSTDSGALQTIQPSGNYLRPEIDQQIDDVSTTEGVANRLFQRRLTAFNDLFTQDFTSAAVATIDTRMAGVDDADNPVGFGTGLILESPDGVKWELEVSNDGTISAKDLP